MIELTRRGLTLGLASLLLLSGDRVSAQPTGRRPKVAILSPNTQEHSRLPGSAPSSLLSGFAELGYVDGQNISFEFRFAEDALERLPGLAAELVATQPDVLWTWASGGARAAAAATSTIPIVVAPVNEAILAEFVSNVAHPAGNVTGLTLISRLQHEKCLPPTASERQHPGRRGCRVWP